ncbi:hypothetical protein AWB79_01874 [Caballeronia hypogeia]|uniref:Purine nucleoside phosphorylase n=1 Tax=Caballeronia hypogeia TaxID=1777140 RepID=A0A158A3N2_9BURK|nr:DUF4148 domain-containing protein [Caballeronia hypogeia]SAK52380.1 hypothetical protein AWB79_01874 [Caballeronia hypogeia]
MKKSTIATLLLTTSAYLSLAPVIAGAQDKTREQVKQELTQARHDGVVPSSKQQYPNTDQATARNKEIHNVTTHGGEARPAVDKHDSR